jgi:hypothetical protein
LSCAEEKREADGGIYLYPVKIGQKWGYIDQNGSMLVEPQFRSAEAFSDGLARVVFDEPAESVLPSNGYLRYWKWGFIDSTGKVAFRLEAKHVNDFSDGMAMIDNQGAKRYPDTIKYIDKTGRIAIDVEGEAGDHFSEGLARIRVTDSSAPYGGKWGFINKSGEWVIQPQFQGAGNFFEGLASFIVKDEDGGIRWGYIDRRGKVVIPAKYDQAYDFHEGIAMARIGDIKNNRFRFHEPGWRYIDKIGEFLDDTTKFLAYAGFSEGLAAVYSNHKYGFINKNMEIVILPEFTHVGGFMRNTRMVRGFHEGLCAASKESIAGRVGCIDTTGQFVIAPVFHTIEPFWGPLARAQNQNSDGKFQSGYINRRGEWVYNDDYEYPEGIP